MTPGLYKLKSDKLAVSTALRMAARRGGQSPQDSHASEVRATQMDDEINLLGERIAADEVMIGQLAVMICNLSDPKLATTHRTLALRHLEDAQSRLLRELGSKP